MQYRPFLFLGVIVSFWVISGCASTTSPSNRSPALRHGRVHDVAVQHPYVGGREIAECLCQSLRANARPQCCLTVRVTDQVGRVLAMANVCRAPAEDVHPWQLADARELLESFLGAVENWDSPFIEITADAAGTIVLASAAFSLPTDSPSATHSMTRPLRMPGEPYPVYLKVVAEGVRRTERLLEKSLQLYYNAQRQAATLTP